MTDRPELCIRPMRDSDVPAVHVLELACFTVPWSAETYRVSLAAPHSEYLVADHDGEILAYGGLSVVAGEAHVETLAVAPRSRGRGLGRALLSALLDRARGRLATVAFLEVRESNLPARRLYESSGFHVAGRRRGYYSDTGEDALIMVSLLDPSARPVDAL